MCLIAFRRSEDQKIDYNEFQAMIDNNSDGTGIMYPQAGRIVTKKFGNPTYRENQELFQEWLDQPVAALHARIATGKSKINTLNAHPFEVLTKERDGVDLWMMHNGIIGKANLVSDEMSDTWHFVNFYLRPLLHRNAYALCNPYMQHMLKEFVGNSRLLFMYGDGTSVIIDADDQGRESEKHNGLWLSNGHSLAKRTTYTPPANLPANKAYSSYSGYGGYNEYDEHDQSWWPKSSKNTQEEYEETWIEKAVNSCFGKKEEETVEVTEVDKFEEASSLDDILDAISDLSEVQIEVIARDEPNKTIEILRSLKSYHLDEIFEEGELEEVKEAN